MFFSALVVLNYFKRIILRHLSPYRYSLSSILVFLFILFNISNSFGLCYILLNKFLKFCYNKFSNLSDSSFFDSSISSP